MQRPYRGLAKDGKWFVGGLYELGDRAFIVKEYDIREPLFYGINLPTNDPPFSIMLIEVIPETVGQSTGWKALKGGKEMFVGDRISFQVAKSLDMPEINVSDKRYEGTIYWDTSRLAYCVDARPAWDMPIAHNLKLIEVIGTIHDPELKGLNDGENTKS